MVEAQPQLAPYIVQAAAAHPEAALVPPDDSKIEISVKDPVQRRRDAAGVDYAVDRVQLVGKNEPAPVERFLHQPPFHAKMQVVFPAGNGVRQHQPCLVDGEVADTFVVAQQVQAQADAGGWQLGVGRESVGAEPLVHLRPLHAGNTRHADAGLHARKGRIEINAVGVKLGKGGVLCES